VEDEDQDQIRSIQFSSVEPKFMDFISPLLIGLHVHPETDFADRRGRTKEESGRPDGRIIDTCAQSG